MKTSSMKDNQDLYLVVYNDGFGLVSESRKLHPGGGETKLLYLDVAKRIEVDSLRVEGIDVVEVNYEYDLVDKQRLLGKYLGETVLLVEVETNNKRACRLLNPVELILEDIQTGEVLVEPAGELVLPKLPQGLSARPALIFRLRPSHATGMRISYITNGLSWSTHYVAELQGDHLGLDAWVELRNESGITFHGARLKLLAGEVNRVREMLRADYCLPMSPAEEKTAPDFEEKGFSDYHLYPLQGVTSLKDNQTKQIRLFDAEKVPYRRYYEIAPYSEDARIIVEFTNQNQSGLGVPFPAGKFKFYQRDEADHGLTFIGEDEIGHTPKDEAIKLCIGEAFDLKCERTCLNKQNNLGVRKESWQITLKNRKEESALVRVLHRVPGTGEIVEADHHWTREMADMIMFEMKLDAGTVENIKFAVIIDERVHVIKHEPSPPG